MRSLLKAVGKVEEQRNVLQRQSSTFQKHIATEADLVTSVMPLATSNMLHHESLSRLLNPELE